ncbi:RluA family pseudouridine synthase [bacterium]|nr:RluA family pseudouridine synthase [bacterium]
MPSFKISKESQKARVDQFLAKNLKDLSRSKIQQLIIDGHLRVNGLIIAKCNYFLKENDFIEIEIPEPSPSTLEPEPIDLDIIYEDQHLIIVNKPPFLTVHPFGNRLTGTLVNALLNHTKELSHVGGIYKPGIVHRLDKDTSGLLIVPKGDSAHLDLLNQFKDRTIEKYYLAIVHGRVKEEETLIKFSIGRNPKDRTKMSIHARSRKDAKTLVKVKERFKNHTYIQVKMFTGRTHQIRVHLASMHHFIVGDKKYGGKSYMQKNNLGIKRQALHAYRLSFEHPITKERNNFEAPLPEDFKSALNIARKI